MRYTSSKWSGNEAIQAASGLGMRLKHSRTNKFEHTVGHLELVAMLDSLVHGSDPVIVPTHGQSLHH